MDTEIQKLTAELTKFVSSQSKISEEARQHATLMRDVNIEVEKFEQTIVQTNKLSQKQEELLKKLHKAKKDEIALSKHISKVEKRRKEYEAKAAADRSEKDTADYNEDQIRLDNLKKRHTEQLKETDKLTKTFKLSQVGLSGSFNKMSNTLTSGSGNFVSLLLGKLGPLGFAISSLVGALKLLYNIAQRYAEVTREISTNFAGVVEGPSFDQGIRDAFTKALKMGVTPAQYAELSASAREASNTLGGFGNVIDKVGTTASELYPMIGNLKDSYAAGIDALKDFKRKGIEPSTNTLSKYVEDAYVMSKLTGLGYKEISNIFKGVEDDVDNLSLLKSARAGEREAIIQHQRQLIITNKSLGMTATQAGEAAKMLNKMLAQKPLERIKQAAKLRVLGSAMGLGPQAELAAKALIAGPRKTEMQKQQLNDFSIQMTNAMDTMAQRGLGSEIAATTLMDKTGLDQYFGKDSPFSTTLGAPMHQDLESIKKELSDGRNANITYYNMFMEKLANIEKAATDSATYTNAAVDGIYNLPPFIGKILTGFGEASLFVGNSIFLIGEAINLGVQYVNKLIAQFINALPDWMKTEGVQKDNAADLEKYTKGVDDSLAYLSKQWDNQFKKEKPVNLPVASENAPKQSIEQRKEQQSNEAVNKNATNTSSLLELSERHSTKLDSQIDVLNSSNNYLKTIAENTTTAVDLATKQLAAITMDQSQRQKYMTQLNRSNPKIAAEYSTLM